MPVRTKAGEIWLVDLGLAAKGRRCLLLSDYPTDEDFALLMIVPHTAAVRGKRWEFSVPLSFLRPGVFDPQQIQSVALARLEKRLDESPAPRWQELRAAFVGLLRLGD